MKKLILILTVSLMALTSCQKEKIVPKYTIYNETVDEVVNPDKPKYKMGFKIQQLGYPHPPQQWPGRFVEVTLHKSNGEDRVYQWYTIKNEAHIIPDHASKYTIRLKTSEYKNIDEDSKIVVSSIGFHKTLYIKMLDFQLTDNGKYLTYTKK